jgi:hypothetical protein
MRMTEHPLHITNTLDEIQHTVQRDAIEHGRFIFENLIALDFVSLIRRVKEISQEYDKEDWYETADGLCIDVEALKALDTCEPPVPCLYYFCTLYYRNVALVTQKAMNDMGLDTTIYEAGQTPSPDVALNLAQRFNRIISTLVVASTMMPQRHLEMSYVNLGARLDGLWRRR